MTRPKEDRTSLSQSVILNSVAQKRGNGIVCIHIRSQEEHPSSLTLQLPAKSRRGKISSCSELFQIKNVQRSKPAEPHLNAPAVGTEEAIPATCRPCAMFVFLPKAFANYVCYKCTQISLPQERVKDMRDAFLCSCLLKRLKNSVWNEYFNLNPRKIKRI